MNNDNLVGENVKRIRMEQKLSLRALAELSGVSKSTICDVEKNASNASAMTLQKIANALKVHFSDLFYTKGEPSYEYMVAEWNESEKKKFCEQSFTDDIEFKTPQEAVRFILAQPSIMGYGGFDIKKMTDDEIMEFANELLNQLKLLGYKYKK